MANRFRERSALKEDRRMNRGDSQQLVGFNENKPTIVITKWMDNKSVLLASTSIGKNPEREVRQWDKSTVQYKDVKCPAVVSMYNKKKRWGGELIF